MSMVIATAVFSSGFRAQPAAGDEGRGGEQRGEGEQSHRSVAR
jgi:hypothetical protein